MIDPLPLLKRIDQIQQEMLFATPAQHDRLLDESDNLWGRIEDSAIAEELEDSIACSTSLAA